MILEILNKEDNESRGLYIISLDERTKETMRIVYDNNNMIGKRE